jgi:hypothetical protein
MFVGFVGLDCKECDRVGLSWFECSARSDGRGLFRWGVGAGRYRLLRCLWIPILHAEAVAIVC